jgi:biopolymer transport protein ExbD
MHSLTRLILIALLAAALTGGARAMEPGNEPAKETPKAAEYKRNDTNFYLKGDLLKADPSAVIIAEGKYTQKGDSYFFTPHIKAPKVIYIEVHNDWIEPITPPDMPASLGVPPDAMQIREPQGDVRVALPSAPANFVPVTDGMTIPNGAVVKTGADATAAVLFGGVDSARLIPNSEAAVQQTVTAQSRAVEVDLTTGGVFSKVGTQTGVKEDYEVQTPSGAATARGTDFVTVAMPSRTDVWIAQGTVELDQPSGKKVGAVSADGSGALKIVRFPVMSDPHQSMMADAETMTAAMNFIPMADQKIKSLRDKIARGTPLTANEQDYLHRIKEVPCLIKLALVETAAAPIPAPSATPSPANPAPLNVVVHPNGTIKFQGATMGLAEFQSRLKATVKATPDQSLVIKTGKTVPYAKLKAVLDSCADAQVKHVTVAAPSPAPPPVTPVSAEPATNNLPAPGLLMHPSMESISSNVPPIAPSGLPAPPTTNAPTPSGP